jgi:hypothetical protein
VNFSNYVFSYSNGRYDQYPLDLHEALFQGLAKERKGAVQLTVHRVDNTVLYVFIYELNNSNSYIGLSVVFNSVYCTSPREFLKLFEKIISQTALNGKLLRINKKGNIQPTGTALEYNKDGLAFIDLHLKEGIIGLNQNFTSLPPSFKRGVGDKSFLFSQFKDSDINDALKQFEQVHIVKKEKPDSDIDRIGSLIANLSSERDELRARYKSLLVQKKNYKLVLVLLLMVLAAVSTLFIFNNSLKSKDSQISSLNFSLNGKNQQLTEQKDTINQQLATIGDLNGRVSVLNASLVEKSGRINELDFRIDSLVEKQGELLAENEDYRRSIRELRIRNNNLYVDNIELKEDKLELQNQIAQTSQFPILIESLKIGNVDSRGKVETEHGKQLLSARSMYLSPKIAYRGVRLDEKITLFVKLFLNERLSASADSANGYSYKVEITVQKTDDVVLTGWGGSRKGHWPVGSYRFEIWYQDILLKSADFELL